MNQIKRPAHQQMKPDYGIDTPIDLRRNALYGLAGVVMGIILLLLAAGGLLGEVLGGSSLICGVGLIVIVLVMLWGSRYGKLQVRDHLLASIPWRGDEMVLDVGCGHGLMLIGAAKRLTTGKAIGVDTWLTSEQIGNSLEATLRNVELEGVADRAQVRPGDARDLPFDNNTFDVIFSTWVIHSIVDPDEQSQALKEIARVLKPGGVFYIVDFDRVSEYEQYYRHRDWLNITRSGPNYLFVNPSYTLQATKPPL